MKKFANELEFISQIERDGSGVKPVSENYLKAMTENMLMAKEKFKLYSLSLTEKTFIAINFNAFIVKLNE